MLIQLDVGGKAQLVDGAGLKVAGAEKKPEKAIRGMGSST